MLNQENPLGILSRLIMGGGQPNPGGVTQPKPQPNPQQAQANTAQPNAKPASTNPPKPGPLEILFPGGLNEFVRSLSSLLGSSQGAPRSFAYGGIAGDKGPEKILVGDRGTPGRPAPEVVIPLNPGLQKPGVNPYVMQMIQQMLRQMLTRQTPATPPTLSSLLGPAPQMGMRGPQMGMGGRFNPADIKRLTEGMYV